VAGYEILGVLGRGGMGVVYRARQISLNRIVALKMILAGSHAGPQELARFRTEAEAVARLQHPNIVQIHEIGEQEGRPYFSLEYIDGGSLAAQLHGTPQPPRPAAHLIETLARAVHYAHERGIVHRDLKPANILLVSGGVVSGESSPGTTHHSPLATHQPKITDFGLAKLMNREESLTATGEIVGTINYMAPEQAWGKSKVKIISPAVDVYALGAILYEMLTGRPPFQGETLQDTLEQVWSEDPVPPRRLQPRVPADLETICLKALQKEPGQRYTSAGALADDLHRFQTAQPILARPVGTLTQTWKWARRNPGKAVTLVSALLVIAGLFLWQRAEYRRWEAEQTQQRQVERHRARLAQKLANVRATVDAQLGKDKQGATVLEGGRLQAAVRALDVVLQELKDEPLAAAEREQLQAQRDRLERIVQFLRYVDEAWFAAGEERHDTARAASESALRSLGIMNARGEFTHAEWWRNLPDQDLVPLHQEQLQQEVYRQLILLAQLRTMPGFSVSALLGTRDKKAAAAFRSAWEVLRQAQELEKAERVRPAQTVRLFDKFIRQLLRKVGGPEAVPPVVDPRPAPEDRREPTNPIDYFFSGCVHYFLGKATNDALRDLMADAWGNDLDFRTPLATAERMLREATRLDPQQFWPHFVLGRTLYLTKQYSAAVMAFNTCVALRPDYPVSYQLRGLALCRQALDPALKDPSYRDKLIEHAHADFRVAQERAPDNPVLYWAWGEFYMLLKQEDQALEAYARGLELEDRLQQMVSRRNVLNPARQLVDQVLQKRPEDPDALAVKALIHLARRKYADAATAAEHALKKQSGHVRALAALGTATLEEARRTKDGARKREGLNRALEYFRQALKRAPDNYLAAAGTARAYEELNDPKNALEAYRYLLTKPRGNAVAVTPGQQVQAYLGQSRALAKLGRKEEADPALREAERIDPAAKVALERQ
jgi:tetratricopeptide (TPR) repeat protein